MKESEELKAKLKERDDLKREIAVLRKRLNKLNSKKKGIIEEIKEVNRRAEESKAKRDRYNSRIQELKKERASINSKVRELFARYKELRKEAPEKDFKKMEMELNRLEWRLQTSVLKVEKEDELVKRIEQLRAELRDFKDLLALSKDIDQKKLRSKKIHARILSYSRESQKHHEAFLDEIKKIRSLEEKIDEINHAKEDVNAKLEELKEALKEKEEEIKKLGEDLEEKREKSKEKSAEELKKEAKLVYERFKKGEKLSTEDLFLLQRFGQI